jgi:major membrane immunogen (membrane-anchored lipoprotein)
MKRILAVACVFLFASLAFAADWKDGVYYVKEAKADTRGYTGELRLTVAQGKITKVEYNESVNGEKSKWKDPAYNANMKKVTGISWIDAVNQATDIILKKGTGEAVDAISGASEVTKRISFLVAEALKKAK